MNETTRETGSVAAVATRLKERLVPFIQLTYSLVLTKPLPGRQWLCVGVGLFLICAATLKIDGLYKGDLLVDSTHASSLLQITSIAIELLLGISLLANIFPRVIWFATIVFFLTLGSFSLYQVLHRQPSCGCFGRFSVTPWLTFILDSGFLLGLVLWTPAVIRGEPHHPREDNRTADYSLVVATAILVILIACGFMYWKHGS